MRKKRQKKEKKPALILRLVGHFGWKPGRVMREVLEWVEVIVVALALAGFVMNVITVRMHVPTGSMIPAIDPKDSFFVDIISYHFFSYHYRDPKPGDIIVFWHTDSVLIKNIKSGSLAEHARLAAGERLLYVNREPVFSAAGADQIVASLPVGTMVVLSLVNAPQLDLGTKQSGMNSLADFGITLRDRRVRYVKRLIAVGGQTVQVKDGSVYVNGKKLTGPRFNRKYTSGDPRMLYGMTPTLVPEGKWFAMGDNSANSWDSRYWGFVDKRDFIGEPYFRVWPFSRFGPMNGYFGS